jgi:ribosomal-protein-alanine N-acetyltransferase
MAAIPSAPRTAVSRVVLRLPEPRDEVEFTTLRRASRAHLEPWEPLPPDGHDPFGPEEFARYLAAARSPRRVRWLVRRREDDALLGACALTAILRGVLQSANLDYWIGARFARQGYMSEALEHVLAEAFGPLELHRVEALVLPENEPSRRLLARTGFRLEGVSRALIHLRGAWRDHERWALTREERAG